MDTVPDLDPWVRLQPILDRFSNLWLREIEGRTAIEIRKQILSSLEDKRATTPDILKFSELLNDINNRLENLLMLDVIRIEMGEYFIKQKKTLFLLNPIREEIIRWQSRTEGIEPHLNKTKKNLKVVLDAFINEEGGTGRFDMTVRGLILIRDQLLQGLIRHFSTLKEILEKGVGIVMNRSLEPYSPIEILQRYFDIEGLFNMESSVREGLIRESSRGLNDRLIHDTKGVVEKSKDALKEIKRVFFNTFIPSLLEVLDAIDNMACYKLVDGDSMDNTLIDNINKDLQNIVGAFLSSIKIEAIPFYEGESLSEGLQIPFEHEVCKEAEEDILIREVRRGFLYIPDEDIAYLLRPALVVVSKRE